MSSAFEDIPTVQLVKTAENMVAGIQDWLDMTPERRNQPGRSKDSVTANISMTVTIPIAANFIRELNRRGIETGWEWLVEEVDAAEAERKAS